MVYGVAINSLELTLILQVTSKLVRLTPLIESQEFYGFLL